MASVLNATNIERLNKNWFKTRIVHGFACRGALTFVTIPSRHTNGWRVADIRGGTRVTDRGRLGRARGVGLSS